MMRMMMMMMHRVQPRLCVFVVLPKDRRERGELRRVVLHVRLQVNARAGARRLRRSEEVAVLAGLPGRADQRPAASAHGQAMLS